MPAKFCSRFWTAERNERKTLRLRCLGGGNEGCGRGLNADRQVVGVNGGMVDAQWLR